MKMTELFEEISVPFIDFSKDLVAATIVYYIFKREAHRFLKKSLTDGIHYIVTTNKKYDA